MAPTGRQMLVVWICVLALLRPAGTLAQGRNSATAQSAASAAPGAASMVIRLEQQRGDRVVAMLPEHVFDPGDVVRFRLTSGSDGYLYVVNQGSSGSYSALFPAPGTGAENRVRKGSDYLVPSTQDGWFQMEGPAGFDVVYFLLSPTPLSISTDGSSKADQGKSTAGEGRPAPSTLPSSLKPRCNDEIFRARGECIDETAGPAALARGAPVPPQIAIAAPNASRDIVFVSEGDSVAASAPLSVPVVYTFRLAHR